MQSRTSMLLERRKSEDILSVEESIFEGDELSESEAGSNLSAGQAALLDEQQARLQKAEHSRNKEAQTFINAVSNGLGIGITDLGHVAAVSKCTSDYERKLRRAALDADAQARKDRELALARGEIEDLGPMFAEAERGFVHETVKVAERMGSPRGRGPAPGFGPGKGNPRKWRSVAPGQAQLPPYSLQPLLTRNENFDFQEPTRTGMGAPAYLTAKSRDLLDPYNLIDRTGWQSPNAFNQAGTVLFHATFQAPKTQAEWTKAEKTKEFGGRGAKKGGRAAPSRTAAAAATTAAAPSPTELPKPRRERVCGPSPRLQPDGAAQGGGHHQKAAAACSSTAPGEGLVAVRDKRRPLKLVPAHSEAVAWYPGSEWEQRGNVDFYRNHAESEALEEQGSAALALKFERGGRVQEARKKRANRARKANAKAAMLRADQRSRRALLGERNEEDTLRLSAIDEAIKEIEAQRSQASERAG